MCLSAIRKNKSITLWTKDKVGSSPKSDKVWCGVTCKWPDQHLCSVSLQVQELRPMTVSTLNSQVLLNQQRFCVGWDGKVTGISYKKGGLTGYKSYTWPGMKISRIGLEGKSLRTFVWGDHIQNVPLIVRCRKLQNLYLKHWHVLLYRFIIQTDITRLGSFAVPFHFKFKKVL